MALLVTLGFPGDDAIAQAQAREANAAREKSPTRTADKRKPVRKKTPKKARRRAKVKPNMPDGWKWPPSTAMIAQGQSCREKLDELGVPWKKGRREGKIATSVKIPNMTLAGIKLVPTFRDPPFHMDCHLALALTEHLPRLFEAGVREIHFSSIYRNTKVRAGGRTKRAVSRHALGLAIDMWAFVDESGRKAEVLTDYPAQDPLLLGVEQALNDSGGFRTVLTPRNDPKSHYDHFHVEAKVDYPKVVRSKRLARRGPR